MVTAMASGTQSKLMALPRFVAAVVWRFLADDCLLHASALAYTTLLSIVPLLALMFSILKGLGVQRRLEPLLLSRLAFDTETTDRIIGYINNTNVGTLGALGAALLVVTVISVLGAVEASFNHIWRVDRGRTYWRKLTDYLSTFLLIPMLLLAAVAVTSAVQEQSILHWVLQTQFIGDAAMQALRVLPILINAVAIGFLYAIMPNRRPYVPGLVVGATLAGLAWYVLQLGYLALQIGVARYNAIYGALAQLPVMLVWIYVSWAVILLGAELAAVYEFRSGTATDRNFLRWPLTVHILVRAADAFRDGSSINPERLAREVEVDTELVLEIVRVLQAKGYLAAVNDSHRNYVLARDPNTIDLAELAAVIEPPIRLPANIDQRVKDLSDRWTTEEKALWKGRTLADLVHKGDGRAAGAPQLEREWRL